MLPGITLIVHTCVTVTIVSTCSRCIDGPTFFVPQSQVRRLPAQSLLHIRVVDFRNAHRGHGCLDGLGAIALNRAGRGHLSKQHDLHVWHEAPIRSIHAARPCKKYSPPPLLTLNIKMLTSCNADVRVLQVVYLARICTRRRAKMRPTRGLTSNICCASPAAKDS